MTRHARRAIWLIAFGIALQPGACVVDSYTPPPASAADALFRIDAPSESDSIAHLPWETMFADASLRELISVGLQQNLELKDALARIEIAEANLSQSRWAFAPDVQVDARYSRSKQPGVAVAAFPSLSLWQLSASAAWEIDVWGKYRSQKRARQAELEASWAYRHAVQTQLIADIATAYYTLLAYDRQLDLTEQALKVRIEDVETVRALKEGAVVTGADVVQSEANRYAAEVALPDIKRNIRELENALSVLLARPASAIKRGTLEQQSELTALGPGVPVELLANRPDVRQAELNLRSAFEMTNVARTFFYPTLTLSGSVGTASRDLGGLFGPGSFIGNILAGLTQPLLNRGLNDQRLRVARAQQQQAALSFQNTLLRAGEEVSNALFSYDMAREKAAVRQHQIAALLQAVDFTKALLRYTSDTNYVDVLTAEQSLLSAQINAVNDRLQQLQAVVALYRALGGGWRTQAARPQAAAAGR